ncbi:MAG: hypothetical protein AAB383_04205 [Patescibacteria group bacterium]
MASGNKTEVNELEAALQLGPDRTILQCTGKLSNGTGFDFKNGEPRVEGVAPSELIAATPDERILIKERLEKHFGNGPVEIDPSGRFRLDSKRTIGSCKGAFPDGTKFEIQNGEPFVQRVAAPTLNVATPDERDQIKGALEENFGKGRIEIDSTGRFHLLEKAPTSEPEKIIRTRMGIVGDAVREFAGITAQEVRGNGMVTHARALLETMDPAQVVAQLKAEFSNDYDSLDLDELIRVTMKEAGDERANKKEAEAVAKTMKLGQEIVDRMNRGEGLEAIELDLKTLTRSFTVNGVKYTCSKEEVEQIAEAAIEQALALKAQVEAKEKRGKVIRTVKNEAQARNPAAEAFKWDNLLRQNNVVSQIRYLRTQGVSDKDIRNDLERLLQDRGVPRHQEVMDYAFDRASDSAFNKRAADRFVFNRNLHNLVRELKKSGATPDYIESEIKDFIHAEHMAPEEVAEIIQAALDRAEAGQKWTTVGVEARRKLPFTDEKKWDTFLFEHGIYRKTRDWADSGQTEKAIRESLKIEPAIQRHKNQEALIDYILRHWKDADMPKKSATHFVKKEKLGEMVYQLQSATPPFLDADIKTAIEGMVPAGTPTEEIDEIVKQAFEAAKSVTNKELAKNLYRTPLKHAGKALNWVKEGVRDTVLPGILKAPGKIADWIKDKAWPGLKKAPGKTWEFVKHNKHPIQTVAKYTTLAAAGTGLLGAAAVVGTLVAGGYVLKKTAPLVLNVGKHLVVDGAPLVKAIGQTVLVNPVKAGGRVISNPFVRAYQAARWGWNYPAHATVKPTTGFFKPFKWARNKLASGWAGLKGGGLALAAGALFSLYGAGEGVANAASKDLFGLNATIPELSIFHAPHGHGHAAHGDAGHAPAAAHGGGAHH